MFTIEEMNDKLNKIHCMDCLDFMREVPDKYFDLVLTDPPYGMNFQCNSRKEKHKKIANDDNVDWLPQLCKNIYRITKDDAHIYMFCSWHKIDIFKQSLEKSGLIIKNILIWNKGGGGMGDLEGDYAPNYEMCIFINRGKPLNGKRDINVINAKKDGVNNFHPTQKPVELMKYLIRKSSKNGDKVFDPFIGGGSTGLACQSLGIDWCGCELESDYVTIANKRLSQVQGSLF